MQESLQSRGNKLALIMDAVFNLCELELNKFGDLNVLNVGRSN